ncbi:MAG: hypothetical protein ACYDHZ_00405 [Dehalococcoidia bacterium]
MEPEQTDQIETTVSPAGEVVSPDTAEIEAEAPATSEGHDEIAALDAAIEAAPTPEAKKSAQDKRNSAWAQMRRDRQAAKEAETKAREEAAFYRGQAEALQKVPADAPVATAPTQPEIQLPPEPRQDDFLDNDGGYDYASFYKALGAYGAKCELLKETVARDARSALDKQVQDAKDQRDWEIKGEQKFPGFRNKVASMVTTFQSLPPEKVSALSGAISDSAMGHDLTVFLADNPNELRSMASLSPFAIIKRVGDLEKKMTKPQPKTTTNAPDPIKPVQVGGEAITDIMQLEGDEYLRAVKAKVAREGRGALYR